MHDNLTFENFCKSHGLIIRDIQYGRWVRVPTEDHPRSANGAYKLLDGIGFVQNHATMQEPSIWRDGTSSHIVRREISKAADDTDTRRRKASRKAEWILSQCEYEQHAYLDAHGFPDSKGLVWRPNENDNLLIIPMRVDGKISGLQMIDRDGSKRFLTGQQCSEAEFVIGFGRIEIWCEGYCTALSVHECLRGDAKIHVCFSAGNLKKMAKRGMVIADNDASGVGEAAAISTGLPYFMPPEIGQDFNDYHQSVGKFRAHMAIKKHISKLF